MEELALIIFTICLQAAIGMICFAAVVKFLNKKAVLRTTIVSAAILSVFGLLASFLHLGQPLHAANALAHFTTSWLSREIWLTGAFTGLIVVAALLILVKPAAQGVVRMLLAVAALIGLLDVYAMASVYTFSGIAAWHSGSVTVEFYAAALSMGAVLFLALGGAEAAEIRQPAVKTAGIAVGLQVIAMMVYSIQLGLNSGLASQLSLALLGTMNGVMVAKWLFILLGTGMLVFPAPGRVQASSSGQAALETAAAGSVGSGIYVAGVLLVLGQIVGRYLFYAIMIAGRVGLS